MNYLKSTALLGTKHIVRLLTCVRLFATAWNAAHQASLSFTISQSLLKLMFIDSIFHLIISSSVTTFTSCPQSFPVSGSFPMSWLFTSGEREIIGPFFFFKPLGMSVSVLALNWVVCYSWQVQREDKPLGLQVGRQHYLCLVRGKICLV